MDLRDHFLAERFVAENGEIYNPVFRFIARYVQGYTATTDNYLKALSAKLQTS